MLLTLIPNIRCCKWQETILAVEISRLFLLKTTVALEVLGEYSACGFMYKTGKKISDFHHIPCAISDQTAELTEAGRLALAAPLLL